MVKNLIKRMSLIQRFSLISLLAMVIFSLAFGKILGSFIEQSVFDESIQEKIILFWTFTGFLCLYLIHFAIVWNESRHIDTQTKELVQSKKDWKYIFNTITDMITIHDKDFNIIRANKAAKKMLRLPSLYVNKEIKCYKHYHETDNPPEGCPSCECLKSEGAITFEIFEPHLEKHLEIRVMQRYNNDNQFVGLIHIARDITDIKKTEEENKKLQEQFLQVQKMESIGRLAGGLAHDFNNSIFVITGFSELALKRLPEESALKDNIKAIHDAGEKAAAHTKKLLAFSRKQVLEMKTININIIIENMMKILSRLIPENVTLEFNSHMQVQKVFADSGQLEQVIMNLAINARDAMPIGGHLIIETSNVEFVDEYIKDYENIEPGSYVKLSVRDTGIGMKKEVQRKIFEPFFTTKEVGRGTGMGLATVYGIIKQHMGYIFVHSKLGKGTEFEIYLPENEGEVEEVETTVSEKIAIGNETILVVDDEPHLTELIKKILEPLGYYVLEASSGEEALQVSENYNGTIDLLLTDVIMLGMNGRELAEMLLGERPETKVIFMSGYTDESIDHHGVLVKGVVLLRKPLSEKKLTNKIREVLDSKYQENAIPPESMELGGMYILLADDNEDICNLIKSYLRNYDCRIDTAENGEIAIEKFKSGKYNLALMDMQMPIMDGYTATKEIRKWEKENQAEAMPIVALTGYSSREDVDKCLRAGCTSHLAKPVKREQLVKTLCLNASLTNDTSKVKEEHGEKVIAYVDPDLKDIIPGYLERMSNDIKTILSALEKVNYETIRILGHSMKGSGGSYGFDAITDIGLHLEEAVKNKNSEDIKKWVSKLSDYITNVEVVYE
jgi:signal transduction histidine kinase/DNA-binding response OmpR family regulator